MPALTHSPSGPRGGSPGAPLLVDADRAAQLTAASAQWPSLTLTPVQAAELELLLLGAFGRPTGYPERTLRDGLRTPTLVVAAETAAGVERGDAIALRTADGTMIAALHVGAICPADGPGDEDDAVGPGQVRLAGRVEGLRLPRHPDYPGLRPRPDELRALLLERDWFQPGGRPPWAVWADGLLHTADIARIRALTRQGKRCVVLAPTGGADPADPGHHLRVRALRAALDALDEPVRPTEATLTSAAIAAEATRGSAAVPTAPATGPPAGAATAGGGSARAPDAQPARALLVLVPVVPSPELAAPREPGITATSPFGAPTGGDPAAAGRVAELTTLRAHVAEFYGLGGSITGPALGAPERDELAALLAAGRPIPGELTPPGVAAELARAYPPRHARGFAVLFTGPHGTQPALLARLLTVRLLERDGRHVTLLDPDADRPPGGVGLVAAEVAAAGGIVVCAPAASQAAIQAGIHERVRSTGAGCVLVEASITRADDVPGSTAPADHGGIDGRDDGGAANGKPRRATVPVDATQLSPEAAVDEVVARLRAEGWLGY